jgi:hypothetical protein
MNINQQQAILTIIDNFDSIDIDQLFIESFPGEPDFSKVRITKYSASDLKSLMAKMLIQLKKEITGKHGLILPARENFQNEWGEIVLENDLPNLYNNIVQRNFQVAEPILDKLIYYQIKYGFWEKSTTKHNSIPLDELRKQKDLIDLNNKSIEAQFDKIRQMIDDNLTTKESITEQLRILNEEVSKFKQIIDNGAESVNQINNLLSSASTNESNISVILTSVKEKLQLIETEIETYKTEFEGIKASNSELDKQLNKTITDSKVNLEESTKSLLYINGQKSEIEKLTGMAADGALGTKFDQRQGKLNDGLKFWKWAVPIMTIVAIIWVVIVFTCLQTEIKNEWIRLGVNLLKTSPAFILLGFVFKQYSKERNLEEEYAFKSAVAMTLTAYSNMLSEKDIDNNKTRQEMLMKSIEQLYAQPIIHSEKPDRLFSFNTRNLKKTVSNLTEAINNIKSK